MPPGGMARRSTALPVPALASHGVKEAVALMSAATTVI